MTHKVLYRELCDAESSVPLFCRSWWLDSVCGEDAWDVVIVMRDRSVVAAMPYFVRVRHGIRRIEMPSLTQYMGPWISYPTLQKYHTRLSFEKEILSEIIEKLPAFDVFQQNFAWTVTNWLPFYWKGFHQTTRYTYVIEDLSDLDKLFSNIRSNIKTDIRKAQKSLRIFDGDDLDRFYQVNKLTFIRQEVSIPYNFDFIHQLDTACTQKGCRKIFFAEDQDGVVHAAIYIVWDNQSAYYLMGGGDPTLRNSGAMSLLIWEAIKFSAGVTQRFDFEGSMLEPVERFFRAFGAVQRPYFHVTKTNSRIIKLKQYASEIFRGKQK